MNSGGALRPGRPLCAYTSVPKVGVRLSGSGSWSIASTKLLRRLAVGTIIISVNVGCRSNSSLERAGLDRVDHLVYGTQDLESAVDYLEGVLGVRAAYGGQHPGRGTHNALLSLGPTAYLEILAPDPSQPAPAGPRWGGLDEVTASRLITWAAKASDLDKLIEHGERGGIPLGSVQAGSRIRPDGVELTWALSIPDRPVADGLVPFFIDWGSSPHPASCAPQGLTLIRLRAEHPDARQVRRMFDVLGLGVPVARAESPALVATIRTAKGIVELR